MVVSQVVQSNLSLFVHFISRDVIGLPQHVLDIR